MGSVQSLDRLGRRRDTGLFFFFFNGRASWAWSSGRNNDDQNTQKIKENVFVNRAKQNEVRIFDKTFCQAKQTYKYYRYICVSFLSFFPGKFSSCVCFAYERGFHENPHVVLFCPNFLCVFDLLSERRQSTLFQIFNGHGRPLWHCPSMNGRALRVPPLGKVWQFCTVP